MLFVRERQKRLRVRNLEENRGEKYQFAAGESIALKRQEQDIKRLQEQSGQTFRRYTGYNRERRREADNF